VPEATPPADSPGSPDSPEPSAEIDDEAVVDELPTDLDLSEFVGPHTFPNNNRRRIPAAIYVVMGAGAIALWAANEGSPLVNSGLAVAGGVLVLFGLYGFAAGRTLRIDESEALAAASAKMGFAVGHASAQMVWRGWLSRPTWRILLYSAEDPPRQRGIVLVDGIDGEVVEWFAESNPEDWSGMDPSRTGLGGD
jgi:hypothetical protein